MTKAFGCGVRVGRCVSKKGRPRSAENRRRPPLPKLEGRRPQLVFGSGADLADANRAPDERIFRRRPRPSPAATRTNGVVLRRRTAMVCGSYAGLAVETVSLLALACSFLLYKALPGLAADFYILYCYALQAAFFASYVVLRCQPADVTVRLFGERYLHAGRAAVGLAAFVLLSTALRLIPAADASAVMKSTPVFVAVLARFALGERFGPARLAVLLLTLAGVFLICRPSFLFPAPGGAEGEDPSDRLWGTLSAVGASAALSVVYVLQRLIRRTPVVVTSLANASASCLLILPPVLVRASWRTADCGRAAPLFACGCCVLIGLLLKFKASRMEEAGRLALVGVVDLPFTMACEAAFMGLDPPWTSYAGSALIVLSVLLVILLKRREERRTRRPAAAPQDPNPREEDAGTTLRLRDRDETDTAV